ncbi:Heat shock protein [Blastocystis sp. ATCC 50177/Nand II]|uniref:Heat shock protein n=1 Tax=Blastocystis sp. subtype 1 (strain ATCC 50177 / NandII) TaxID=478820 RepID=A0A196SFF3_BLAHN|nr:Heat shock protein [Blastocystis sp. ATCC 50177/Nand II]OAO15856.1 Heat shock protein [Blastocystis sp. ATCC 50177/Nand II]
MSFIFRDPFFDGFDDFMNGAFSSKFMNPDRWGIEDEVAPKKHAKKASAKNHDSLVAVSKNNKITPFSGFGRMDMRESDKDYQLSVDIPGMDKDGIKVTSENNVLVIEGERKQEKESKKDGNFRREMSIPSNADATKINAVYENGVLKVVIPKVEKKVEKKMITVN